MSKRIFAFGFSTNCDYHDEVFLFENYEAAFEYVKYCARQYRYDNSDANLSFGDMNFVIPLWEHSVSDDNYENFTILLEECDENANFIVFENPGDSNYGNWDDYSYSTFATKDGAIEDAKIRIDNAFVAYNDDCLLSKEDAINDIVKDGHIVVYYDGDGIEHNVEILELAIETFY